MYARIENNKVVEVIDVADITGMFHPSLNWQSCPSSCVPGWVVVNGSLVDAAAGNTQALWQAAHDYEFAQLSGVAVGLLVLGVLQQLPKALAVQQWSQSIWTLYYTRKAGVTSTYDPALQDFTSCGPIPHSIPDLMAELGLG